MNTQLAKGFEMGVNVSDKSLCMLHVPIIILYYIVYIYIVPYTDINCAYAYHMQKYI